MPPKIKVTKETILSSALQLLRRNGAEGLNARQLARELGCSTQPIFSNYASMEALRVDLMAVAWQHYWEFARQEMNTGKYPAYKSYGMAYIQFAIREPELFRLLFMSARTAADAAIGAADVENVVAGIQKITGFSRELAVKLHGEMWIFVHGTAVLLATSTCHWDQEQISAMVTDVYMGLKARFTAEG